VRKQKNDQWFQTAFVRAMQRCFAEGFQLPLVLVAVGGDSSLAAMRFEGRGQAVTGNTPMALFPPGGTPAIKPPVNIMVVDAKGEAARIVLSAGGQVVFDRGAATLDAAN
jgi:hypothetical protein